MVDLYISASQFESFAGEDGCERRWWFQKVKKYPEVEKGYKTFGTVLHAVIERYLNADDLGRDRKTGKPVELYPKGWETAVERDGTRGTVSPVEADLIRRLVAEAIAQGVLVRLPGQRVEAEFTRPVVSVKYQGQRYDIKITGFIDVLRTDGFDDHKSTKSMRYAKSANALRKNAQMLIYGWEFYQQCIERAEAPPYQPIRVVHNVFSKDPNDFRVKSTAVLLTYEDCQQFFQQQLVPAAKRMVKIRHVENWTYIPDPPNTAKTCNKYGGCPYRPICGRRETAARYVARVTKIRERSRKAQGDEDMASSTLAAKLGTKTKPQTKTRSVTYERPKPAPKAEVEEEVETESEEGETEYAPEVPPWTDPTCKACEGTGFNSKGRACRICEDNMGNNGIIPSMYNIDYDGDGGTTWEVKPEFAKRVKAMLAEGGAKTVAAGQAEMRKSPKGKPKVQVEEEEEIAEEEVEGETEDEGADEEIEGEPEEEVVEEAEPEPKGKRKAARPVGRPKSSFTLFQGCAPTQGAKDAIYMSRILMGYGEELAKSCKAQSYYDLDAFDRRDKMAAVAERICEEFGTRDVIVDGDSPDLRALADACRPFAGRVIVGTR